MPGQDRTTVYINARFLSQPLTGVQRYGHELVRTLDLLLEARDPLATQFSWVLLAPKRHLQHQLLLKHIPLHTFGHFSGHFWEQGELPRRLKDGLLFCPGNTAPLWTLFTRIPVVVTIHDLSSHYFPTAYNPLFKWLYKLLTPTVLRRADTLITVSNAEQHSILQHYPQVGKRLVAIQNGGLGSRFLEAINWTRDPKAERDIPRLLYVGALNPRKNPQGILQALSLLNQKKPVHLTVVGSRPPWWFQKSDFSLPEEVIRRVTFVGQVNDTWQLIRYYQEADCFVFPSFYEASPFPPLEAMSCGCPVVCSEIPSLVERCGEAALYCDPHRPEDIAQKIERVLEDRPLRQRLVEKGWERAGKFTWERCARETLKVIARLLAKKERG